MSNKFFGGGKEDKAFLNFYFYFFYSYFFYFYFLHGFAE